MNDAETTKFVYVTFIRTTPEKLWSALTDLDFARQYWFGAGPVSEWRVGATWHLEFPDGRVADAGEILEVDPPKRLVIKWRNEFMPELKAEGYGVCVIEIEPVGEAVKLSIDHSMPVAHSKTIQAVSGGWPKILSNLKSLLETGAVVLPTRTG